MKSHRPLGLFGLALLGAGIIAARRPSPTTVETRRIQAHFDSVLSELAGPPGEPRSLSSKQAAHRAALLEELRRYRDRGVFPHNYDFPGEAVPYFVDRKTGTLCAVANLMAFTGHRDVVDRVAAMDNNVLVPTLGGDTAFIAWLDRNGLTIEEAARIQVPYIQPEETSTTERAAMVTVGIAALAGIPTALGTSIWNAWGNSDGHRRLGTTLGIAAGVTTATLGGLAYATGTRDDKPAGAVVFGVGAISAGLAIRALHNRRAADLAGRAQKTVPASASRVTPSISVGADGRVGTALEIRF
jgi:hypothetical protein